ncbi:MAG: ATP-dependent DNA ligase [Candidatus Methanofastidiosia archaeon]
MNFKKLAELCEKVASTTKKLEKIEYLSGFLKELDKEEISLAVLMITGQVFPETSEKTLDVSWKTIKKAIDSDQQPLFKKVLTITDVHTYFRKIAKTSERKKKQSLISALLSQASQIEQKYILKNFSGEMRIGASEGIMLEAIAKASNFPPQKVKKAHALLGDLGETAVEVVINNNVLVDIKLYRPIKPMLAHIGDIQDITEEMALEYKLDGARIQIHKNRDTKIFSRRLTDVTASLPDIVDKVKDFPESVTEGEVVAEKDGKPLPFQELLRRFRRIHKVKEAVKDVPLNLYLFDVLYVKGDTLLDMPYKDRIKLLSGFAGQFMVDKIITDDIEKAHNFLNEALKAGHEGLMAKKLNSVYKVGKRDQTWLKIKVTETLDLIITAAEWGHGRRKGWLSNYHLATKEGNVIGKTFKGLTDTQFEEITKKLLDIKTDEGPYTVYVNPDIVVEVAFNEIQKSPTYKSGYALRFARIKRIRYDKSVNEADTLQKVETLYEKQFRYKAKLAL